MRPIASLSHARWECKYHVAFIPKYRRKALFGQIRREIGEVFHRLAEQKESEEQATFLHNDGCRFAQGFLFHQPLSAEGISKLLR